MKARPNPEGVHGSSKVSVSTKDLRRALRLAVAAATEADSPHLYTVHFELGDAHLTVKATCKIWCVTWRVPLVGDDDAGFGRKVAFDAFPADVDLLLQAMGPSPQFGEVTIDVDSGLVKVPLQQQPDLHFTLCKNEAANLPDLSKVVREKPSALFGIGMDPGVISKIMKALAEVEIKVVACAFYGELEPVVLTSSDAPDMQVIAMPCRVLAAR
jgi:hypothetical protein